MKNITFFLFLFITSELFSQSNIFDIKIDSLNNKRTEVISIALSDSICKKAKYVYYKYDAVVFISNMTIRKTTVSKTKLFRKKENLKIVTIIYNPFKENDLDFYLYQINENDSIISFKSDINKSVIYNKNNDIYPIILIEKPLFSLDFKNAIIRISIDYKGGGVGYEIRYYFNNGIWVKTSEKMIYRC